MDINCSEKELFLLKKIAHAASDLQMPCYVIGGFVRDKLLSRATKDADIVCVGDGITLAHRVAERFQPKPTVAFYKNFGTASIKIDEFEIEFVRVGAAISGSFRRAEFVDNVEMRAHPPARAF